MTTDTTNLFDLTDEQLQIMLNNLAHNLAVGPALGATDAEMARWETLRDAARRELGRRR